MPFRILILFLVFSAPLLAQNERPNILFCIADDWGWPHAGSYGDTVVQTPTFDGLAQQGILFENAFVSSPSCTPSRGAVLTGQHFWRLGEGANLWSTLDVAHPVYPLLLEQAGYFVGSWRKAWGPGDLKAGGYTDHNPAGKVYKGGLEQFLAEKPQEKPFCFWLGASDPHRPYEKGSGATSGIDLNAIELPPYYPDSKEIRSDIADYYYEVQRFDKDVAQALALLQEKGELENTLIVVTGDHGMPFPRAKGNLYDMGARVPLVISWPRKIKSPKRIQSPVSLTDLAPTFLEAARVAIPEAMTGKALNGYFNPSSTSKNESDFVLLGRERHTPAQKAPSLNGYPSRAIRTNDYLYICNYAPDRWPAGVPEGATHPKNSFTDSDSGPTKTIILAQKDQAGYSKYYDWCFGPRPAEELYAIAQDRYQTNNLAQQPEYAEIKKSLAQQLEAELIVAKDPRVLEQKPAFDSYPYRARYKLKGQ
ncbi:sulfatase family protein [Sediminicola luteus]|uniref:Sulfatase N-terminal domain-containing protein n=1 Tax=Sediminicola luteus TaxID=319238 RepID=A0A2A4GD76_9FLAO|nr:sulfatase [Sediminicola luteus]PCE66413.1 hypothetical protein B7P33_03715 [Sediminicola luteus]